MVVTLQLQAGEATGPAWAPQPARGGSEINGETFRLNAESSSLALVVAVVVSRRWAGTNPNASCLRPPVSAGLLLFQALDMNEFTDSSTQVYTAGRCRCPHPLQSWEGVRRLHNPYEVMIQGHVEGFGPGHLAPGS